MYSTESRQLNRAARCSPRGAYFFSPCEARANPPFNLKGWRTEDALLDDPRFMRAGYSVVPPVANANYIKQARGINVKDALRFADILSKSTHPENADKVYL